jgi:tetratricopeptide (TPR) repeat protein
MHENIFLPRLNNLTKDNISEWLHSVARTVFIITFGLLPIFFIPNIYVSLGFTKTYLVVVGVSIVLVLFTLAILRRGVVRFSLPLALGLFWSFVVISLASAFLSGDRLDSLYGNNLEVQTAGFFVLMGVIMTTSMIFGAEKSATARLLIFSGGVSIILLLIQIFRLFFGPNFLSLGLFTSNTSSFVGSFNDLAIFAGLVVLVLLLLVQSINFGLLGKTISAITLLSALLILAVVNFSFIWITLGSFSLIMLLYILSRDTWLRLETEEKKTDNIFPLILVLLVVFTSVIFVIGGNNLGSTISKETGITYLEVRPSLGATFDTAKAVFAENILLGAGPNHFEDAWRQHKDVTINQTEFWSTDFTAGSGFVPTIFVTTGLAGGVLFLCFLLSFLYIGYRTFFTVKLEHGWYLVGIITFVSAIYLWLIAIFYVPGSLMMLLTALMTGLALAVYSVNNLGENININVVENRHYGLVLIFMVLVVIVTTVISVLSISKQYLSQVAYADTSRAFLTDTPPGELDVMLQKSEELYAQDIFIAERARLRLLELNKLISLPEPTPTDQQNFQIALTEGISLAERAIALDTTNPFNYALLASFYGLLDPAQTDEIKNRRDSAIERARELDPTNPSYLLLSAQFAVRHKDWTSARNYLNEAIKLKGNYTDALFMLSQLDIIEGNTDSAINTAKSIIMIEPNNPTRYFQLGVLLATKKDLTDATLAFQEAIRLDNNYANARYFLALTYLDMNKKDEALSELKIIETTNSENHQLKDLISSIETGKFTKPTDTGFAVPVNDGNVVDTEEDITTSSQLPETDLIKPLNQVSGEEDKKTGESNTDKNINTQENQAEVIE